MEIYLADKQDITRAGLIYIIDGIADAEYKYTEDKDELLEALKVQQNAVVILDYTLFDINDVEELLILNARFPQTRWLLFSENLSLDFVRRVLAGNNDFSILLKDSPLSEIREAIDFAIQNHRYICQSMTEMLLKPESCEEETVKLTKTETEILKDIALGMTTKEIAAKRFSSFHTINTHRKNIFRKLGVNNIHEATRYALRAGLVDSAEYYI
ncbi:MAG: response regulator transcription factor [Prevotella sp.]|jgi:DNA-binding NarL/FixJ family response regulator|nr:MULTISPECIES: response regulator transcription factor [unclassified Prevotella]MCH3970249.1 response regulator transcription factor [Prevotella sp.]MCH3992395.1 response regulator transcription factor [Prevotella sp.]MCH4017001.1 response regulator transcription factor [Prevotella sp.]MCH4100078.1 response regulator transcription factor [Prevotella sp.]MCH4185380.1 response regulator transcription factor [Prevotella sp.]